MRVVNISEEGVLFAGGQIEAELEQAIRATVFFADSDPIEVAGQIIRIDEMGIAVQLTEGIPMHQMIHEQRRLKTKYMET